ncbi:LPXTG cell wall anchor domain [Listeria fleischmannii subsp. fleischmannii]|uniref:LPXTG cell wall anchor domain n=2 Tax=Listeria fleischmannii TaxID=1069827 RepID=A0A2X3GUJ0_9LIST|nr:immunoglobulin-like domain-containing protein [Listeria fleischmannii]SQC72018.1 LPXTG cell wall anchor domain [Listeria fleischmannii subsp. fleischmannii]
MVVGNFSFQENTVYATERSNDEKIDTQELTVDPIQDKSRTITGKGIPGHYVNFLNSTQREQKGLNIPVDSEGNYSYSLAEGERLNSGDVIIVFDSQVAGGLQARTTVLENKAPTITGEEKTRLNPNQDFDVMSSIEAIDTEDGDLTNQLQIVSNTVDTSQSGSYEVIYKVTDLDNHEATFTRTVIVTEAPIITGEEKVEITENETYSPMETIHATDKEDGDLTSRVKMIDNPVDIAKQGSYTVTYEVVDQDGNRAEFKQVVVVTKDITNFENPEVVKEIGKVNKKSEEVVGSNKEQVISSEKAQETLQKTTEKKTYKKSLNEDKKRLPKTGDSETTYFMLSGMSLVIFGGCLILRRKK